MHYTGIGLDRAAARRDDPAWIAARRADPRALVTPMWRDRCLVAGDTPVGLDGGMASLADAATCVAFLGLEREGPRFAADLSDLDEATALALCGADRSIDSRELIPVLTPEAAGRLAYARGLLHWHRHQRFCGACGTTTQTSPSGHFRTCPTCDRQLFPRIEPAVIALVERDEEPRRCLLARPAGANDDSFSTVAGFVEVGEGLEDAVRREVAEETGIRVGVVTYQGSQAWPFPAGLMVGFRAVAESEEIAVDEAEIAEARWFTAKELCERIADPATHRPFRADSIGKVLVESWLADYASA